MLATTEARSLSDRRRDATRDGIVEAAWQICRANGLGALSLRDLGQRVGLRAPSLYAYFDSKSAIYDAMFAQGYQQLAVAAPRWESWSTGDEQPRMVFKRGAHQFVEFCTSDPVRYQLMFQRVVPDFEPTAATYAVAVAELERMGRFLAGVGITDPEALDLWTAIITGLTDQQISNDPGGDRWIRLVDTAVDIFCDYTGIPSEGDQP